MSKKEELFELFNQGKRLGDPEVDALELSFSTLRSYLADWKKLKEQEEIEEQVAEPVVEEPRKPEPPPGQLISTLKAGQLFKLDGNVYKVLAMHKDHVLIAYMEWSPSGEALIEKHTSRSSLDTVVNK